MSAEPVDERLAALRSRFEAIDSDGDGYITEAEFRAHFPGLPAEAMAELDRVADVDGDGRFSFPEFLRVVDQG